ncbi:MAG: Universal stress protein family [Phycisphaerales bacterium]|nr:Universal stress protein family [Phycisphaerales bacterium]
MSLETLLVRLEGFLRAEQAAVTQEPADSDRARACAERNAALGLLQTELNAYRAAVGGGMPFRRILVAVDDSQPAGWAIDTAARLALGLGGKVGLVHVVPTDIGCGPDIAFARADLYGERHYRCEELLQRAAARVPGSIGAEVMLKEGEATRQIVATAREWGADLIVLGAHGRGRVAHFVLGSTAEAVVRHAHCPVLTIGRNPAEPALESKAGSPATSIKEAQTPEAPAPAVHAVG